MNHSLRPLALLVFLTSAVPPAMADPHKDEGGHGRKGRHAQMQGSRCARVAGGAGLSPPPARRDRPTSRHRHRAATVVIRP